MPGLPYFYDYHQYKSTRSCYLDGRYFNRVFSSYPGLIKEPLVITLTSDSYHLEMDKVRLDTNYDSLLRVVIETPLSRHTTLAILDHSNKLVYWFQPFPSTYDHLVEKLISIYTSYRVERIPDQARRVTSPNCAESGFCLAYCLKYAYDYLNNHPIDLSQIRSFAARVEAEYGHLPGDPDISYGDQRGIGGLVGGLTGAGVGLALGGVPGALIGGGLGGLGGYYVGSKLR